MSSDANGLLSLPARSTGAPVVRSVPAKAVTNYAEFRPVLRWDFWYSCGYCTIAESEAAGLAFSIDHYLPQSRFGALTNVYDNLIWTCNHCNSYKHDNPPDATLGLGYRVFRPDIDDPNDHFEASSSGTQRIDHRTQLVGEYTIELLNLNRLTLRRLRAARAKLADARDTLLRGLQALDGIKIQSLPRDSRTKFLQIRDRLTKDCKIAQDLLDETLIKEFNRSDLVDPPAEATQDSKARRFYLKQVHAAIPKKAVPSNP